MRCESQREQGWVVPVEVGSSSRVRYFPRRTSFGWSVNTSGCTGDPRTSRWMTEFNDEIKHLQNMIKRYSNNCRLETKVFGGGRDVFVDELSMKEECGAYNTSFRRLRNNDENKYSLTRQHNYYTGTESKPYNRNCDVTYFHESSGGESSKLLLPKNKAQLNNSVSKDNDESLLYSDHWKSKRVVSNQCSLSDSGFEESLGLAETQKELSFEEEHANDSSEDIFLSSNENEPSTTPKSEEYCSIQSVASRDSGIYTTEDVCTEQSTEDKSLLEELDNVCSSYEHPSRSSLPRASSSVIETSDKQLEGGKHSSWYIRYSFGDCSLPLSPLCLSTGHSLGDLSTITASSITSETINYSLLQKSTNENSKGLSDGGASEGISKKLYETMPYSTARVAAIAHRSQAVHKNLLDMRDLTSDFDQLNDRLQTLSLDLETLTSEVNESREDFKGLESKATQLTTAAMTSRERMSNLYAMQALEVRLQEEWWAAYNADTLPLSENYIV